MAAAAAGTRTARSGSNSSGGGSSSTTTRSGRRITTFDTTDDYPMDEMRGVDRALDRGLAPQRRTHRPVAPTPARGGDYTVPVAVDETPMIQRNRAMRGEPSMRTGIGASIGEDDSGSNPSPASPPNRRASRRRSSIGMRGKRASTSSSGLALPASEFYRHIDAEQSDPVRMRQLLIWCAHRAKASMSSDITSQGPDIAKQIIKMQDAVIAGLVNKQINTSWYHRSDNMPAQNVAAPCATLPNPENLKFHEKKAEKQAELEKLQREERLWAALSESVVKRHTVGHVDDIVHPSEMPGLLSSRERRALEAAEGDKAGFGDAGFVPYVTSLFEDVEAYVYELQAAAGATTEDVRQSRSQCEKLFATWLRAHEKEAAARSSVVEPLDILRLIPPSA
ncbi:hypothetical protein HK405_011660, partial [Cladochytrium tenue]